MRKAQASGAHPNATANNVKLLGEAILCYAEAGRWSDFTTTLKFVREMADQNFASLNLVRSDEKKLGEAKSRLVSAEQVEEQVSTTLSKRALDAYKAGNLTEAEKLSGLAHISYAHRLEGIARSGDEGVAGFADLSATSRMADLKLEQGDLYIAAGNKKEAELAYRAARSVSCPFVSDSTRNSIKNKVSISDVQQYAHANNCAQAEFGEMKANGELDRLIEQQTDAQLRLQYSLLGLDYDKIRAKAKAKN